MDEQVCFERLCARLRIRQLRLRAEIGTVGRVHAAARRIAMSQPAASQALTAPALRPRAAAWPGS